MRRCLSYILLALTILLFGCDVHEFPATPEHVKLHLDLHYETKMAQWDHLYDGKSVIEAGLGEPKNVYCEEGLIRYVVRAAPVSDTKGTVMDKASEFMFVKEVAGEYDTEVTIDVLPGEYNIMVWSDFVPDNDPFSAYSVNDFSGIMMQEDFMGSNEYNDAFRGTNKIVLSADLKDKKADTLSITMERPLAKFEFVANDLPEFVKKVTGSLPSKAEIDVEAEDYKVRFYYVGFKPDVYSMLSDRPVDSSLGVTFESTMNTLSTTEVKMGFDYVFVGDKSTAVTLQVGVYDQNDRQISLTDPIKVPLMRDRHTVLTGAFLTPDASKGVQVDPDYDGDHNWILP